MQSSHAYRPTEVATGCFQNAEAEWQSNAEILVGKGTPAGGSASTAADLVAFGNALLEGKLVSAETLQDMTTPYADMEGTGLSYGYGFTMPQGEQGTRAFGHLAGFLTGRRIPYIERPPPPPRRVPCARFHS